MTLTRSKKREEDEKKMQLPLEMIVTIFKYLKIHEPLVASFLTTSDRQERLSILNAGSINIQWRNGMEMFLKTESSSFFKQWLPESWSILNPYCFPCVQLILEGKVLRFNCPPFVFDGQFKNITNSICFTGRGDYKCKRMPILSEFLPKRTGATLKSITFCNLYQLPARALQRILNNTPNVEALSFGIVRFLNSPEEMKVMLLPELRKLAYMRIWDVNVQIYSWLIEPYQRQLVLLTTGINLKWSDGEETFPVLRYLQVDDPHSSFYRSELQFSNLQSLSIRFRSETSETDSQKLKQFLHKFAGSLKNLHLDFGLDITSSLLLIRQEGIQTVQTLPLLKTFSVNFPAFRQSVESVKHLLYMFPQLEHLQFFRFFVDGYFDKEKGRRFAREHLKQNNYSAVCRNLNKIVVQAYGDEGATPFVEECAPFPK